MLEIVRSQVNGGIAMGKFGRMARREETTEAEDRYRAPALDKGLDIIELLAATDQSISQAEIAKSLDRSPSEIYRMLDRLVQRGYVIRGAGDRYELSLKLFALAHQHPPLQRLVAHATPILRQLAREAEQSCHLAIYQRGRVLVVAQVDAPGYWTLAIRVGAQVDLLDTGSGHVLLAFQSLRERAQMLAERGEPEPADHEGLHARLDEIVRDGVEVMASRQTRGVVNISAPVLGPQGTALAALTCPYVERVDGAEAADRARLVALVCGAARQLSLAAGRAGAGEVPARR